MMNWSERGMVWHYRRCSNSTAMQGFEDYAKEKRVACELIRTQYHRGNGGRGNGEHQSDLAVAF